MPFVQNENRTPAAAEARINTTGCSFFVAFTVRVSISSTAASASAFQLNSAVSAYNALGLDSVVSPRSITCANILRYVRARANSEGTKVEKLHRLVGGKAEALEFVARANDPYIGVPLKDLHMRKDTLVAVIVRNRQVIVPNSKINSAIITNSTIKDTRTCVFVEVGVAYSENLDHCIDEMRKVIEADPRVLDKRTEKEKADGVEKVIIRVLELGSSSITLRAYVWAPNPADAFVLKCDLLKAVKDHYDEVGIEIPYPYMNVVRKA